ncbi:MAG TPA: MAPEG family protein [Candidatus Binataceae bacterium]|nr:MAPEG family protein [Candidatus Binataceae bacterium]
MAAVELVLTLALIEYWLMGFLAGRARLKYGVAAPATSGHPTFERYYRVHQNTLEQLMVFVPALLIFALGGEIEGAIVLGALFILARLIYAVGYIRNPDLRYYGAGATSLINGVLLVGALIVLSHRL